MPGQLLWRRFLDQYTTAAEDFGHETPLGVEYTTEEAILQKQHSAEAASEMHGTHCLGIAAGSGFDTNYRGMAYEADLCVAANLTGNEVNYSANEVAVLKYIFDYADAIQQPCVITYSIGFDYIPGDAALYEEALSQLLGPGHVLVAAAGNENGSTKYMHKRRGDADAGCAMQSGWFSPAATFRVLSSDDFTLSMTEYSGQTSKVKGEAYDFDSRHVPDSVINFNGHDLIITRQDTVYTFEIPLNLYGSNLGTVGIVIEGEEVEAQLLADYYTNIGNATRLDSRLDDAEDGYNVCLPGTLPDVVTVGAMCWRRSMYSGEGYGKIASFSSVGPTIDGRIKPDVVAPGVNVYSALNSFYRGGEKAAHTSTFNGKQYGWIAESGTSMATPAAAGAVALWLQADPTLTPEGVLDVIRHTSQQTNSRLTYPNNTYGYGHIDAYRGLLYILGIETAVRGMSLHQPAKARFTLNGRQLTALYTANTPQHSPTLTVYTTDGRTVATARGTSIDLSALPRGVYAVQLNTGDAETTGSTLIRL